MKKITPPRLSTAFSESGKSAKRRIGEILNTKTKRLGAGLAALAVGAAVCAGACLMFRQSTPSRVSDAAVEDALQNHGDAPSFTDGDRVWFAKQALSFLETALTEGRYKEQEDVLVRALLEKAVTAGSGEEMEAAAGALSDRGVYLYGYDDRYPAPLREADSRSAYNVQLYAPIAAYNAVKRDWVIACGGVWLDDSYGAGYLDGDVGSPDSFGVRFVEPAGSVPEKERYARISSEDGGLFEEEHHISTISYLMDDGGQNGFGFSMRDYCKDGRYVGYRWYAQCVYGEDFAGLDTAAATAFYNHSGKSGEFSLLSNDLALWR